MSVHSDFAAAFSSACVKKRSGEPVAIRVESMGELELPSGHLAIVYPSAADEAVPLLPFVPPGRYPVDVCLADEAVACLRLRFEATKAVRWIPAVAEGALATDVQATGCVVGALNCVAVTDRTTLVELLRTESTDAPPPPDVAADRNRLLVWRIENSVSARQPAVELIAQRLLRGGSVMDVVTLPEGGQLALVETAGNEVVFSYFGVADDGRVVELVVDVDPLVENDWEEAVVAVPPTIGDVPLPGRLANAGRLEIVEFAQCLRVRAYRDGGSLNLRDFSSRRSESNQGFDEYEYPPKTKSISVVGFLGLLPLSS